METYNIVKSIDRASLRVGAYVDLATGTKTSSDFTVMATIGITPDQDVVIINVVRGRWEWPDARRVIIEETLRQQVPLLGIEATAFQMAAFQDLMRSGELGSTAVRAVKPDKDKVTRSLPLLARAEAGKLYLVRAHWNRDLIAEFLAFPESTHDDQVDAVSGALLLIGAAPKMRVVTVESSL